MFESSQSADFDFIQQSQEALTGKWSVAQYKRIGIEICAGKEVNEAKKGSLSYSLLRLMGTHNLIELIKKLAFFCQIYSVGDFKIRRQQAILNSAILFFVTAGL